MSAATMETFAGTELMPMGAPEAAANPQLKRPPFVTPLEAAAHQSSNVATDLDAPAPARCPYRRCARSLTSISGVRLSRFPPRSERRRRECFLISRPPITKPFRPLFQPKGPAAPPPEQSSPFVAPVYTRPVGTLAPQQFSFSQSQPKRESTPPYAQDGPAFTRRAESIGRDAPPTRINMRFVAADAAAHREVNVVTYLDFTELDKLSMQLSFPLLRANASA